MLFYHLTIISPIPIIGIHAYITFYSLLIYHSHPLDKHISIFEALKITYIRICYVTFIHKKKEKKETRKLHLHDIITSERTV